MVSTASRISYSVLKGSAVFLISISAYASWVDIEIESHQKDGWKLRKQNAETRVYSKSLEGSTFFAFKGIREFSFPKLTIYSLITNIQEAENWIDLYDHSLPLGELPSGNQAYYQALRSPFFMVSPRDIVAEVRYFQDVSKKRIIIESKSIEHQNAPETIGVRVKLKYSQWIIEEIDKNTTRVSLEVLSDPGGLIPSFVVNFVQKDYPVNLFDNLFKRLKKGGVKLFPPPEELRLEDPCFIKCE